MTPRLKLATYWRATCQDEEPQIAEILDVKSDTVDILIVTVMYNCITEHSVTICSC